MKTTEEKRRALEVLFPIWQLASMRDGSCSCRACFERLLVRKFNFRDLNPEVEGFANDDAGARPAARPLPSFRTLNPDELR
jgi:hypothetical protein